MQIYANERTPCVRSLNLHAAIQITNQMLMFLLIISRSNMGPKVWQNASLSGVITVL